MASRKAHPISSGSQSCNSLHRFLIHAGFLTYQEYKLSVPRQKTTVKMFSLPVQHPSFVLHNRCSTTFSNTLLVDHKPFSRPPSALVELRIKSITRIHRLPVAEAAAELAVAETPDEISDVLLVQDTQDAPRSFKKPRLVLKFIWMDKNIGLGLDQVLPRYGTVPLSPYFFWPRKDAWEELKATLESKPWISQKKMIILLNQATDIINLWQQSGGNLS